MIKRKSSRSEDRAREFPPHTRHNPIPGWGLLFNTITAHNQRHELVYRAELVGFSKLRDYRMPMRLVVLQALTRLPGLGKLLRRR